MASATSLMADDNFSCSICLDVFTKPVSIPCGHTFCQDCITKHWETVNRLIECPQCKETYLTKPMLRVNIFIADMAERFKTAVRRKSSSPLQEAPFGKVLCNLCIDPAVKSCLVCFMSFCTTHLQPHQTLPNLQRHKLIQPVNDLQNRLCKTHGEPLEFFCRGDQMFLCLSCKVKDHKMHTVVTLEEEANIRKIKLGKEKESTDQMIKTRQQIILDIQSSLDRIGKNADQALSYKNHAMAAVADYIQRSQIELTEVINTKLQQIEKEGMDFTTELDAEILQIKEKKEQLDKTSLTDDDFTFLENALSSTVSSPKVKDWPNLKLNTAEFAIQDAMDELQRSVKSKINTLCDPTFREKQQYAVDVTFDPDTAHPLLNVSADGKQVATGYQKRNVDNKEERFQKVLNVLAKEGFSSGKFYYEVQVRGKTQWDLGVVSESINRKGDIRLSPKNGYWTIWFRNGNELTANAGPAVNLPVRQIPEKVGVFVDYEEGQVSFYDVDARATIFSFMGNSFTTKLFPFFSPCVNEGGKNSAALIITPVTTNH
ncbi:E3 ubiquitin-protein ligase TRIM21-like [Xiphophorus couchianus]|uniref:E3 ubiquitin-protein ligase TRIM21-like n=1 Tax=Xiphophorus couchianus TaxID=32473 RepID=UPI001016AEA4|nr:E3 ubiquitin-protein ligase TRIM21-like [Xiphophorus couchianus]